MRTYNEERDILIEISDKIRYEDDYKFNNKDLEDLYEIMGIEDPIGHGFQDDETYIILYIDGMRRGYILGKQLEADK